jgi:hypothetical protein
MSVAENGIDTAEIDHIAPMWPRGKTRDYRRVETAYAWADNHLMYPGGVGRLFSGNVIAARGIDVGT